MKLLSMSGFVPEQICDTVRFMAYNGTHKIPHYCGYAADFLSQVLEDEGIDGAVFPHSCDSCRIMPDYLADSGKFIHQIAVPARQDGLAADFLAHSIKQYQRALEKHYGIRIRDIPERIALLNERNRRIRELYDGLKERPYGAYIEFIHKLLRLPLSEQLAFGRSACAQKDDVRASLEQQARQKPVYLIGSFLSNTDMASGIEAFGMKIVGDNLTESKRLFSAATVCLDGDPYRNIAQSILGNQLSPTQDHFEELIHSDLGEIKRKQVEGVIFITQKYCEPYDYLFSVYKKVLDHEGIPSLHLTLADTADHKKSALALESFRDIL